MEAALASNIRFPHLITEHTVYVHVKSWGSALGASVCVKRFYPGRRLELVSEERLAALKRREEEG